MKLENILNNKKLILELFKFASKDNHKNNKNYLTIDLENYLAFHFLTDNNNPVGFGGIYKNKLWQNNIRVLNRWFMFPEYRLNGLSNGIYKEVRSPASLVLLEQIPFVLNLGCVPFFSIQDYRRKRSISSPVNLYNKSSNKNKLIILPGLYYTGTNNQIELNPNVWQTIATVKGYEDKITLRYLNDKQSQGIFG